MELLGRYSKLRPGPLIQRALRSDRLVEPDREEPRHDAPRIHKPSRRLTPKDREALIDAYLAGETSLQLMERFNLGKGSVLSVLHEANVPMRGRGLPAEQLEQAVTHYESGLSLRAVGAELGCDAKTVRKALKAAGVAIRPRNGWPTA